MDAILLRLEEKIDRLTNNVAELKTSLAVQQCAHTNTADRVGKLEKEMEPVRRQIWIALGAWKLVVGVGVMAGIGEAAAQVATFIAGGLK